MESRHSAEPPELRAGEVHILWGRIGDDSAGASAPGWISPEEEERARRFVRPRHGRRFRGRRAFLRRVLARHERCAPEELVFSSGAHGKPALDSTLSFNLSHTDDVVLLALSRGRAVGADVQVHRLRTPLERVARQFLDACELAQLDALSPGERLAAFFRGWSRKEAALKAIGDGLVRDPRTLHLGLSPRAARVPWRPEEPLLGAYSLLELEVPCCASDPLSACVCAEGDWRPVVREEVEEL